MTPLDATVARLGDAHLLTPARYDGLGVLADALAEAGDDRAAGAAAYYQFLADRVAADPPPASAEPQRWPPGLGRSPDTHPTRGEVFALGPGLCLALLATLRRRLGADSFGSLLRGLASVPAAELVMIGAAPVTLAAELAGALGRLIDGADAGGYSYAVLNAVRTVHRALAGEAAVDAHYDTLFTLAAETAAARVGPAPGGRLSGDDWIEACRAERRWQAATLAAAEAVWPAIARLLALAASRNPCGETPGRDWAECNWPPAPPIY